MVEYNTAQNQELDMIFHALSDTTRRQILDQVKSEPQRVTDLAQYYDVSLNAISKHIKVLEKANFISREVKGRVHWCSFNGDRLRDIEKWINLYKEFWEQRLDALDHFVKTKVASKAASKPNTSREK